AAFHATGLVARLRQLAALPRRVVPSAVSLAARRSAGTAVVFARRLLARHLSPPSVHLTLQASGHEVGHDLTGGLPLVEEQVHLLRDRHLHADASCEVPDRTRVPYALGHFRHASDDVLQALTPAQSETDGPVPRLVAGAREDEVAEAGEASERPAVRAQTGRETRDLRQAARDESGPAVEPESEPIAHARGERDHVLHRAADLDPDDVRRRVHPERGAREDTLDRLGDVERPGGRRHGGRRAERDLAREAWSREDCHTRG